MVYIGIDIGKRFHIMSAIGQYGEELSPPQKYDANSAGLSELTEKIRLLAEVYGEAVLGMEATGHYWYVPFRYLSSKGYRVYCLNPHKTKALRTLWGYDKTKTDDIDCLAIAEVLRIRRLDDSSPLDTELLGLKQLTRTRAMLMKFRKQAKMRLRNLLDQAFPEYETHFTNIFGKGSLAVLKRYPTPTRLLAEPFDDLLASVKEDTHKQFRKEKLEQIIESAKTSCGICFSDDYYELQIKLLVGQIEFLNEQIAQIDERLSGFVNERHSNLLTIPGLGSVALGKIVAEIGDVRRFKNISSLVSYAGLAPRCISRERQSAVNLIYQSKGLRSCVIPFITLQ